MADPEAQALDDAQRSYAGQYRRRVRRLHEREKHRGSDTRRAIHGPYGGVTQGQTGPVEALPSVLSAVFDPILCDSEADSQDPGEGEADSSTWSRGTRNSSRPSWSSTWSTAVETMSVSRPSLPISARSNWQRMSRDRKRRGRRGLVSVEEDRNLVFEDPRSAVGIDRRTRTQPGESYSISSTAGPSATSRAGSRPCVAWCQSCLPS